MANTSTEQQLLATLLHEPKLLLQSDKYQIESSDFSSTIMRYIYWAIENLAPSAKGPLTPYEVEKWISNSPSGKALFDSKGARQFLIDCDSTPVSSFDAIYMQFKRENLIRDLNDAGYKTDDLYVAHPITEKERKIAEEYARSTPQDILSKIEKDFMNIKSKYTLKDTSEVQTLFDGLADMMEELEINPEMGLPLQGKLFNHIVSGALLGKFYLRSGSSGLGKTRSLMADACHFAFPIRYNWDTMKWEQEGYNEKVLIVITEQDIDEVQKMAVAYLTGINESVFKRGQCNDQQKHVIKQAMEVFKVYQDNFLVVRVPNPSISLIRQLLREQVTLHEISYVFYDYIFISPSLLSEFKGMSLRNDEILLMFSDALKQLAVELDIFIMSSTQVNANADNANGIRNEASLAGSRAVINKADMGCIMARPSTEELKTLEPIINTIKKPPNIVTDIYKVRGGEYTQVRIWSYMDLGIMRKEDLFVTDSRMDPINIGYYGVSYEQNIDDQIADLMTKLNGKEG